METPCRYTFRLKERGNALRVYLYAQRTWAGKWKHPAGIPLCPENVGGKVEIRL